jgi:hypothetical protein
MLTEHLIQDETISSLGKTKLHRPSFWGNNRLEELIRSSQEIAFHPGTSVLSAYFLISFHSPVDRRKMTGC